MSHLGDHGARRPADRRTHEVDPCRHLRMLAVEISMGRDVEAARFIRAGADALEGGIESGSLRRLAALHGLDIADAHWLFLDTIAELGLVPELPTGFTTIRWTMVRWWAECIAAGDLDPVQGGYLIWHEGWDRLGWPAALQPIIGATSVYEDWSGFLDGSPEPSVDHIVDEAEKLRDGPWPPF